MTSTTAEIREDLIVFYPQMSDIAEAIKDKITERTPATTETINTIIDRFIDKAKKFHDVSAWGDLYDEGVILLSCHFLLEAQPKATNSGMVVKERTGSESETEYLRPSLKHFGQFSTTKYGRAWEAMKTNIFGDFAFVI